MIFFKVPGPGSGVLIMIVKYTPDQRVGRSAKMGPYQETVFDLKLKQMILTSEWCAEHPFAGQNT